MAQPSSGTYAFQPSMAEMVLEAFDRIQIRPTSITAQHMHTAVMSANFLQSEWTTQDGPDLWKVSLISVPLVQGTATYSIPTNVVDILDYYLRLPPSGPGTTDIVVEPISRTEYADQPDKQLQERPTSVWWDRQINSTVTMWPTPDGNGPYTLYMYVATQLQDATLPQGATLDIPYRFFDAFAAGLAARLAVKYPPPPPNSTVAMQALYDKAWGMAAMKDSENVPLFIVPGISFYTRN